MRIGYSTVDLIQFTTSAQVTNLLVADTISDYSNRNVQPSASLRAFYRTSVNCRAKHLLRHIKQIGMFGGSCDILWLEGRLGGRR